jgi:hypothetical protein
MVLEFFDGEMENIMKVDFKMIYMKEWENGYLRTGHSNKGYFKEEHLWETMLDK